MLATLLHFMQGTPYIYQGEELGMTNAYNLGWDDFDDIEIINGRKFIVDKEKLVDNDTMLDYVHYKGRDNARTPMQWTAGKNAGFTDGIPWLKLNDNFETINATAALADEDSVFYHYQKLIKLRHDLDLITTGHYELIDPADDQVYTYKRIGDDQELLIINNFTDQNLERDYPVPADAQLLIINYQDDLGLKLRPYEAKAYLYNR
ncbi:Glycosidase/amylase (phosphorylase) (AmyA) [Fructobacillus cardui]|nr:Glycosidase/amylase (phosphorylase) (AmyA) [Fructobacillus cardui]